MQTTNHVAMGTWPTQEDWLNSEKLLLAEIHKSKEGHNKSFIDFSEFMICVLFILEKVGVKAIVNANDMMNCLEKLYDVNRLFYPSDIFRGAWLDIREVNTEADSRAKIFLNHLKEIRMIRSVHGKENVLLLCSSDYASEEMKKLFHFDLENACFIFNKFEKNKKFISQISFVAKDLLLALHKGEMKNNW